MKSAPISEAALRGAERSLSNDLDHLVGEPYRQARRTLEFARANKTAHFVFENGTTALDLELANFRRTYLINVTLADISHVSASLNSARDMGFVEGAEWPWSVHLLDLRVVSELLASPAEFILYLDRRLALNSFSAITGSDELDYLGLFLNMGLYFTAEDVKGVDSMSFGSYTVGIDRYYDYQAGRVDTGERPRLGISPWYRALVDLLESVKQPGRYYVASLLLAFDGKDQERVQKWFTEASQDTTGDLRSITLVSLGLTTMFFTASAAPGSGHEAAVRNYIGIKRSQTAGRPLVWVDVAGDMSTATFEIHESPHEGISPSQQAQLDNLKRRRFIEHCQRQGRPERNERCPCGSGSKFKRCCIDQADGWISAGLHG